MHLVWPYIVANSAIFTRQRRAMPRPLIYSFTNLKEPDLLSRTGFGYTGTVYERTPGLLGVSL